MTFVSCLYSLFQGPPGSGSRLLRTRGPPGSALPPPPPASEDEAFIPSTGSGHHGPVGARHGTFCYIFSTVCLTFSCSGVSVTVGQVSGVQGGLVFSHPPPGYHLPPGWHARSLEPREPRGSAPELFSAPSLEPHSDHLIQAEIIQRLHRAQNSLLSLSPR